MAPVVEYDGEHVCTVCGNLKRNNPTPRGPHTPRSRVLSEWRRSAADGCRFCGILIDGLEKLDKSWCRAEDLDHDADVFLSSNPLNIQLSPLEEGKSRPRRQFCWFNSPGHEKTVGAINECAFPCSETSGAFGCLDQIPALLERCVNEHVHCKGRDEGLLPTRVIDIGNPDAGQPPFLYPTKGERARYITLSHCWGGYQPLKTEQATFDERCRAIPLDTLPQTFRDTVAVARRLGVQYVWIDSLCIVQDTDDWSHEAGKMSDVYGNAYLSISASASPNPTGGLFYGPFHGGTGPFKIDESLTKGIAEIHARELPYEGSYPGLHGQSNVGALPLTCRAWCFQEWLLPPRNLHFGHSEITWTCYSDVTSCSSYFYKSNGYFKYSEKVRFMQAMKQDSIEGETINPWDSWMEQVSKLTTKDLTFKSDRLPCVAGIAKSYARVFKSPYIGGMWQANIRRQLCWSVASPNARRSKEYVAPSFSWASIDGQVNFQADSKHDNLPNNNHPGWMLFDAVSTPKDTDPFSKLVSAHIELRAPVAKVQYRRSEEPSGPSEARATIDHFLTNGESEAAWNPDDRLDTLQTKTSGDPLYVMQLAFGVQQKTSALVIEPVADSDNTFRRLGYASLADWNWLYETTTFPRFKLI